MINAFQIVAEQVRIEGRFYFKYKVYFWEYIVRIVIYSKVNSQNAIIFTI